MPQKVPLSGEDIIVDMATKVDIGKGDIMVDMTAKVNLDTGEIVFDCVKEVENLALEVLGTAENIFFEEIPIGDSIILKYDNDYFRGWILETLNTDCI